VGDKHHRLAHLLLKPQELVLEPRPVDRVDRPEWLVHQHQRRVRGKPPGHANALSLTAGQLSRITLGDLCVQPDQLDQLFDPRLDSRLIPIEEMGNGGDVLLDGQVREEADLLDHVADLAPELVRLAFEDTSSPEQDLARGQRNHAVDEPHGSRLARARRTNKHTDLAGSDAEAQVLQRVPWLSRITLADVAQLKRRRLTVRR
jgi:hypothetical protein